MTARVPDQAAHRHPCHLSVRLDDSNKMVGLKIKSPNFILKKKYNFIFVFPFVIALFQLRGGGAGLSIK